jgi:hypothetical protein
MAHAGCGCDAVFAVPDGQFNDPLAQRPDRPYLVFNGDVDAS